MVNKIDDLDLKIIYHLQNDGRISSTELAEKIGTSRQTASNRLKRLRDNELIIIKGGLNLRKLGFKMASVGLEVKKEATRKRVEKYLRDCPRVVSIFRTPEKANIHLEVLGENDQTIASTVESFRDLANVDIVYIRYLGTPIHDNIMFDVAPNQSDVTPCGMTCVDCHRYINEWCVGCPTSSDYKNPFLK
jgi:DNA-binding Lrp family transcriptional regulator